MNTKFTILISLLFLSLTSFAQSATIVTTGSNIKNPSISYSTAKGLTLTFNKAGMTSKELKALEQGFWVLDKDFLLDSKTCKKIGVPARKSLTINKGKYPLKKLPGQNFVSCNPKHSLRDMPMGEWGE